MKGLRSLVVLLTVIALVAMTVSGAAAATGPAAGATYGENIPWWCWIAAPAMGAATAAAFLSPFPPAGYAVGAGTVKLYHYCITR